ncbi:MAG: DUF4173 domain-containing protein [Dehalococcoidia bacterium]
MNADQSQAVIVRPLSFLAAFLLLGVAGDVLFHGQQLGINVLLWTIVLAGVVGACSISLGGPIRGEGRMLLLPALVLAGFVAWRAYPVLQAVNVGSLVAILSIASFRLQRGHIRFGAVTEYLWLACLAAAALATGMYRLAREHVSWPASNAVLRSTYASPLIRGLAVALPLLAIFAGLFAAADFLFADILRAPLEFDVARVARHIGITLVWGWIGAAVVYGAAIDRNLHELPAFHPAPRFRWGIIEVSTVLGLLDLLFLAFVAVQIRYLFGGAGQVQVSEGLTYAEYARHGFFELLAVAALVLPVVLGAHWLLRESSPVLRVTFRVLATTLVLLLFVVIASAFQRMRMYVDEFGLTQLRLYATVGMAWLALTFAWLIVTVLRERRQQFAFGALLAGLLVVFGLNVLNPDAFIVNTNVDRADTRAFDAAYALSLSPDATPTLIAALPRLGDVEACAVAEGLAGKAPGNHDWQEWNYGRNRADGAIVASAANLEAACALR